MTRSFDIALSGPVARDLETILQPFLAQSARLGVIVAVGCGWLREEEGCYGSLGPGSAGNDTMFLRLATVGDRGLAIVERIPMTPADKSPDSERTLATLARQANELSKGALGDHLLLITGDVLKKLMVPFGADFGFRAVVTLPARRVDRGDWKLQRALFDHGLIGIGAVAVAGGEAHCFLASDTVSSPRRLGAVSRGTVAMTTLGHNGRFGNQLFQYAFLKMYALRHGVTAAVPPWSGKYLYGFDDPSCNGIALPQLSFPGGHVFVHELWDVEEPPVGVDMQGYFQDTPPCWRQHRRFLRRLFQLPRPVESAIDAWRAEVTRCGERTLVAIHIRRGDYRNLASHLLMFRLVPEEWYLAWLRTIWPTLRDPLLFVATDEPDVIRPVFKEFESVSATFAQAAQVLPDFLRDFEILRRADYLAMCNSSFSRMAAILADSEQKCFLPTFKTERFAPYEPWLDPDFWARFRFD